MRVTEEQEAKLKEKAKEEHLRKRQLERLKQQVELVFVHLYLILWHWISTGQSKCREGSLSSLESHCFCEGEGKRWTRIRPRRCCASHAKESSPLMETNITMNHFLYIFIHITLMIKDSYTIIMLVMSSSTSIPSSPSSSTSLSIVSVMHWSQDQWW